MQKLWQEIEYDQKIAEELQQQLRIHPIFCRLLAQRKIENYEAARIFFRPKLSDLHDPFLMKGMYRVVPRILQAIEQQEKILIYGDYDADGVTSVSLLYSFLSKIYSNLDYYIPDRYKEGYGVSYQGIEYAQSKGVSLLITVDCGITAHGTIGMAQHLGIDCIICDHHLPEEKLPEAYAILNPKQNGCDYPYKELSGCGVAFKLAQAINQQLHRPFSFCEELLDLVAISIAADIVEMRGENRILMHHGLKKLNTTKRLGLKMLIQKSQRELPFTVSDIVFGIAPLLNAAGRLADAEQAVRLLLSQTKNVAADLSHLLELRNKMRREFDERIAEEAKILFESQENWQDKSSIVLFQNHWHKGVIGIAASRMVDHFHRPTIILTESNGHVVGSARSVRGVDIHEAIKSCSDLLINFGGHQYAAGLKMNIENVPFFQDRLEAILSNSIQPKDKIQVLEYSTTLDLKDITPAFWEILQQFAPFGPGNRNPVFRSEKVKDTAYSKILKDKHLRLSIKQGDSSIFSGIGFGLGEKYDIVRSKNGFDVCYNVQMNKWKGNRLMQLMVKDLKSST